MGKFTHLTYEERLLIERMYRKKIKVRQIAETLGYTRKTIYNELHRGAVTLLDYNLLEYTSYSADIAQKDYDYKATSKGRGLNIGNNIELARQIEYLITKEKYSPYHVIHELDCNFCLSTLYSYIDKGIFLNLSNKHLNKKHKRKYNKVIKKPKYGTSIEYRSEDINNRSGCHWEMDLVIGKKQTRPCLLVLTERKSRIELIYPIKDKSAKSVNQVLSRLKRNKLFSQTFQSITCDNGSEFAAVEQMETDHKGNKVTQLYYCHPYTSCERGSNENANRIIRRFYPKGTSFDDITQSDCVKVCEYMNNMHRKIHNGKTAKQVFNSYSPIPIEKLYNL